MKNTLYLIQSRPERLVKTIIRTFFCLLMALNCLKSNAQMSFSGPRTIWNIPYLSSPAGVNFTGNNLYDLTTGTGQYFTLFNFETGKTVAGSAFNTDTWHIGFHSQNNMGVTRMILNRGGGGTGTVTGYVTTGASFENYIAVPNGSVFSVDGIAANGSDKVAGWTAGSGRRLSQYNTATISGIVPGSIFGSFTITPVANRLLIMQLPTGKYVKFELLSNYKNVPTSIPDVNLVLDDYGFVSFRYLISPTSDLSENISRISNFPATSTGHTFLDLASGMKVETSDSASTKWTMGFKGTNIILNGGINGPATTTGIVLISDFNAVMNVNTVLGLVSDNAIVTGSDNGWFNYNFGVHTIRAIEGRTILIKTTNQRYAKIRMEGYYQNNPAIICSQPSKYYTLSYYLNPYGLDALNQTVSGITYPALPELSVATTTTISGSMLGYNLSITSNINWLVAENATWFSIGGNTVTGTTAGINSGVYGWNADKWENYCGNKRTTIVTLSGCNVSRTISIVQNSLYSVPQIGLSTTLLGITSIAGTNEVTITSSSPISWTAQTNAEWLTVNTVMGNNNAIQVTNLANTNIGIRMGYVTISGCNSNLIVAVNQSGTGSITSISQPTIDSFSIFPNPTVGNELHINTSSDGLITLLNAIGTAVYQKVSTLGTSTINLDGLAKGLYIVQFTNQNNVLTKKIIVQ